MAGELPWTEVLDPLGAGEGEIRPPADLPYQASFVRFRIHPGRSSRRTTSAGKITS